MEIWLKLVYAHINGFIADSATTVIVGSGEGPYQSGERIYTREKELELIETANEALNLAISHVRDGAVLGEIGKAVEEYVKSQGFLPVANLTGHSLDQWNLHSGLSVPNVNDENKQIIEEGMF